MLLALLALAAVAVVSALLAWLTARAARGGGLGASGALLLGMLLLGASWPCRVPLGPGLGLVFIHWYGERLAERGHRDPGAVQGLLALLLLIGAVAYLAAALLAGL